MPFTVFVSEGSLSRTAGAQVCRELSEIVLKLHGLSENPFMRAMVVCEVVEIPAGLSFVGGAEAKIAVVEGKVPAFAFGTPEIKSSYVSEVAALLERATAGTVERSNIFTNTVTTVDGLWGIGGRAYTNLELGAALEEASSG